MAELTPISPKRAANAFAFSAAEAGGDSFPNTGKELVLVRHTNGAGSDVTLTITTTQQVDGEDVADKQVTIGAGTNHLLGPFPRSIYNDGDGKVSLAWSDATDIELAVIQPF